MASLSKALGCNRVLIVVFLDVFNPEIFFLNYFLSVQPAFSIAQDFGGIEVFEFVGQLIQF